ncbi:MAG TPA: alpha/beta fold hydrolase [Intrasporangiaceae bacterium]|nr:alpha/beta fold hydrolase [Intrasporangiaceae bacterium]
MKPIRGHTVRGLRWVERGHGVPVLILSGFGVAESVLGPLADRLAARHHVLTFDASGVGGSWRRRAPVTTAQMAHDALDVLDHHHIDRAHVYGISLGGMVAQEVALAAPHRLRSLILASTSAGGWSAPSPGPVTMARELARSGHLLTGVARPSKRTSFRQAWAAATHDATGRLDQISAPTLILHGARDRLVPRGNGVILARGIPDAELHVLPGRNHLFPLDPADPAVALVEDRIARLEQPLVPSAPAPAGRPAPVAVAGQLVRTVLAPALPSMRLMRTMVDRRY